MTPQATFDGSFGGALRLLYDAGPLSIAVLAVLVAMSLASWQSIAWTVSMQRRLIGKGADIEVPLPDQVLADLERTARAADVQRGMFTHDVQRIEWLQQAIDRRVIGLMSRLGSRQSLLATVGATAPFIGLMGTVVGIQRALTAIGKGTTVSIADLAGPVGEALLMTALGLVVAIPAVLGHNYVQRRNAVTSERLRRAGREVLDRILLE